MNAAFAATDGFALMEATFSPPLVAIPGDEYESDGSRVYLVRGGVRIDSRGISAAVEIDPPQPENIGPVSSIRFFRKRHMAGISLSITGATVNETGGVLVSYGDSTQSETTLLDMQDEAAAFDQDSALAKKILRVLLIRNQPDLNDPHAIDGTSVAIDSQASQPIIVNGV